MIRPGGGQTLWLRLSDWGSALRGRTAGQSLAADAGVYRAAGTIAVAATMASALAVSLILRAHALGDAQRNLDYLSNAVAEQQSQLLQTADLVIQQAAYHVVDVVRSAPLSGLSLASDAVHRALREGLRSAGPVEALTLIDREGQVVNSSRSGSVSHVNVKERDFFKALRDDPALLLFVSEPVPSQMDDRLIIPIARRLPLGPAEPRALIVGVLLLKTIESSFAGVAFNSGTKVTLLREDGTVLARSTTAAGSPGLSTDANRLSARHRLHQTSLWIEVSQSADQALAGWRLQTIGIALLAVIASTCVLLMMAGLARQLREHASIRHALALRNQALEEVRARLEGRTSELQANAAALRAGETLLAQRSTMLDTTLQYIDQGIMMIDGAGNVVVYNHRVSEMLGLPEELLSSYPPFSAILQYQWETGEFTRTDASVAEFVRAGGITGSPRIYQRERPNGQVIEVRSLPLPNGGIVRTYTDITDLRRYQARIERAALTDELTDLPNRLSLRQELERRLLKPVEGEEIGLLYLNLDRFRLLNDARGHDVGDQILTETARRLQALVMPGDIVSRTGGDEFAVLHVFRAGEDDSLRLGERMLQSLSEPHTIGGVRLAVTVSIGVAAALPGASTDTVLRNADIAMYRAKDAARNQLSLYDPAMSVAQQERFQLEQSLREALASSAFRLAYQPIVSLETDTIVGYEALLRWTDHVRGDVSPALFIPVAEATGLIVPLGRLILEWACFEAASWPNTRTIAVNLSPAQFQDETLLDTIKDVLHRSRLAPSRLELEVTEGMLLENTQAVHDTMLALREIGVSLTLDDFGTGHAGLSTLRRFPFEKIKIDRSFVSNLGIDREADAIVEAVLLLGRRLNLRVVAEGVELESQLEQLRRMQCPFVQGYLTGRPQPPSVLATLACPIALQHSEARGHG